MGIAAIAIIPLVWRQFLMSLPNFVDIVLASEIMT